MRFNLFWTVMWLALSSSLAGCAANMAMLRHETHQYRDPSVLERGAHREGVIGQIGQPIASVAREDGAVLDLYRFDPHKRKSPPGRWQALTHFSLSLLTYGIWEVVGMPIEKALKDRPLTCLVVYDAEGRLAEFEVTQEWLPASVAEADRKRCELGAAMQAMRVSTPPAHENPFFQIKDSLRVNRDRDDAYQRALLGCLLPHYAARSERGQP